MKTTICKSGLKGWEATLQEVYIDYDEFVIWNEYYGIAKRIGFKSSKNAWERNPIIQGSVNPSDLRRVRT